MLLMVLRNRANPIGTEDFRFIEHDGEHAREAFAVKAASIRHASTPPCTRLATFLLSSGRILMNHSSRRLKFGRRSSSCGCSVSTRQRRGTYGRGWICSARSFLLARASTRRATSSAPECPVGIRGIAELLRVARTVVEAIRRLGTSRRSARRVRVRSPHTPTGAPRSGPPSDQRRAYERADDVIPREARRRRAVCRFRDRSQFDQLAELGAGGETAQTLPDKGKTPSLQAFPW